MNKITLDRNAQPRLALSQDTINEYCEAIIDGDTLPPVVVFKDGKDYFLADGYHRYHAAGLAGYLEIDVVVKKGTLRDAILYSLSANAKHGLNRTISDKRRSVMICLDDKEWSKKTARDIAELCGVSHTFVYQLQADQVEKQERDKKAKEGGLGWDGVVNVYKSKDKIESKQSDTKPKTVGFSDEPIPVAPEGQVLVDKYHYEEILTNYEAALTANERYEKIVDADEPLQAASNSIKLLTLEVESLRGRMNGLMNERNEAVRLVKSRDSLIKKLKQKMKDAGIKD